MTHRFATWWLFSALLALWPCCCRATGPPALGLAAPMRVIGIVDGDTIDVEITTRVRVRLLDCWAAELNTQEGKSAKLYLEKYALGRQGVLFVPHGKKQIGDSTSLGRALGYAWITTYDESVNETMVQMDYATTTKEKRDKKWPRSQN